MNVEIFQVKFENPWRKLIKYIFMYYLCRTKAIQLFPGEKSYNKSMTYPLEAGIYTIKKHVIFVTLRMYQFVYINVKFVLIIYV